MNTPFAASDVHLAPLSDVDDGFNDLIMLRGPNGGRVRMARLLTGIENGEYWNQNGEILPNLPIDYVKARTWELRPHVKTPQQQQPNDSNFFEDQHTGTTASNGPI